MKILTKFLTLFAFLIVFCGQSHGGPNGYYNYTTSLSGPTNIAANATNTTSGTAFTFTSDETPVWMRVFATSKGTAATTNGTLNIVITISYDGTTFDNYQNSNLVVSGSSIGNTNATFSQFFYIYGAKAIRYDSALNTFSGPCSNTTVNANITVIK